MIAKLRRNWRLSMSLCVVGLGLMLLCLGRYKAFGQEGGNPTVQFSAGSYTVAEGDTISITVTLSASSINTVTVNYATSNGTGRSGVDYTSASGTLTFSPGTTSQSFNVSTITDAYNTSYVTADLTLSSPSSPFKVDASGSKP